MKCAWTEVCWNLQNRNTGADSKFVKKARERELGNKRNEE